MKNLGHNPGVWKFEIMIYKSRLDSKQDGF